MNQPLILIGIFALGVVVSFINSWAGGGASLSLPVFILLGYPPTEALGTNRVGIIWGSLTSALRLRSDKRAKVKIGWTPWIAIVLGTVLGTSLVLSIPSNWLNTIIAVVIIVISFFSSQSEHQQIEHDLSLQPVWKIFPLFFLIGFYGGFLQVGFGLVMIFVFAHFFKMGMISINYLKGSLATLMLVVSAVMLGIYGQIHWVMAMVFGLGNAFGGWLGAILQLKVEGRWIKWVVSGVGTALAIKLLWKTWIG